VLNGKYGEEVNFINIYTIDAHPAGSTSPYSDGEWTGRFSTDKEGNPVGQPLTYQERVEQASKTVIEAEIDNPVWCTYGPAPNIAYFIGTDGKIIAKQGWYDPELMEREILSFIEGTAQINSGVPASAGEPPDISHSINEGDDCLICHGENGLKPFPGDHTGRNKDSCLTCHKRL